IALLALLAEDIQHALAPDAPVGRAAARGRRGVRFHGLGGHPGRGMVAVLYASLFVAPAVDPRAGRERDAEEQQRGAGPGAAGGGGDPDPAAGRAGCQRSRSLSLSFTSFHWSASGGAGFISLMTGHCLDSSALSSTN